ncbi:sce7725 family protein [Antarcticibacterium arcticum]|uniref:Sce7725 family protein n=1 Tax=Antarcticibacterium arcticum TaxID=2585771 RepID=A0A5B8YJF7_9FLAO|nr:sce7725 family protein [Antarcticibacterium arcticum]QED38080.1 sce7725 family protein [Antarcticibacterium arcticum]
MYYPFLRGRQFELIALRELSQENEIQGYVSSIIEPVKKSLNSLTLANRIFFETNQSNFLILNPEVGEKKGDTEFYLEFLNGLENCSFKPAFHFRRNSNYIREKIEKYQLRDCLIIGTNEIQSTDQNFREVIEIESVRKVVINDPDRNRDLKRYLQGQEIEFIRLDDLFEPESRNSNFLPIVSHRFSEEHKYFLDDNYSGFSDYTILSSDFIEGGSTPRAVVIHFTYMNNENQIWIRHFTSNSNDTIADVQGKFGEAARKAVEYCRSHNLQNSAIIELEDYFDQGHYPGLGMVKKISIKNHITLVANYLRSIE